MVRLTNKRRLPEPIVAAVSNDTYSRGDSDISVTQLISPVQIRRLTEAHADEIEEDVADRVWSLLGQAVHSIIERASGQADTLAETTVYTHFDGKKIKGTVDNVTISQAELADYKCTNVRKVKNNTAPPEWVTQTNIYRWMLQREYGLVINSLAVIVIFRDWTKYEATRSEEYPQAPSIRLEIPIWSDEQTEAYVSRRLAEHFGSEEIPCTEGEIWAKPTKWAVHKHGRASAVRVFDSEEEANLFTHTIAKDRASHYVIVRPGEAVRCSGYCPVATWCKQWEQDPRRKAPEEAFQLFSGA